MTNETATPAPDDGDALVTRLLGEGRASKFKEALTLALAASALYRKGKGAWETWRSDRVFQVTVLDTDDIYSAVAEWLLDRIPDERRRGLRAQTARGSSARPDEAVPTSVRDDAPRRLILHYDGTRSQTVSLAGHQVEVEAVDREYGRPEERGWGKPGRIVFRARDLPGRGAVLDFLREITAAYERDRSIARVFIGRSWGSWNQVRGIPARPLSSVVLRDGVKELLVEDIATFLRSEEAYVRHGIPWHRGLLLHGPPGTGKTSIAKTLASHFDLDIYYVPLSDLNSDSSLSDLLSGVEPRSLLLLEDIDVAHASRDRSDANEGVTVAGLLNALDGVVTPHGLITVMTTNNLAALDGALLRAGRADRKVLIDYLDDDQYERLVEDILHVRPSGLGVGGRNVPPCDVVEVLKAHLHDDSPDDALRALEERFHPHARVSR